jgi:hypothetical protein
VRTAPHEESPVCDLCSLSRSQPGSSRASFGSHASHGGAARLGRRATSEGRWPVVASTVISSRWPQPTPVPVAGVAFRTCHGHTPEELAAFDLDVPNSMRIRGDALSDDEKWCPGGCGKGIHRDRRHCGRRWCDAVRPSWAASFRSVIHAALNAYCDLHGSEAKVLRGVLTCTAKL